MMAADGAALQHRGMKIRTTQTADGERMRHDPLRFHRAHRDKGAFGEGFVPRMAERVADAMGTVQFVIVSTVVILAWVVVNHVAGFLSHSWHGLLHGQGFDPAPFILLNLVFSAVAYYSASMVMIAQKTQAKRDLVREQADAEHREDLARTQCALIEQNTQLTEQVHQLTIDLHALICDPKPTAAHGGLAENGDHPAAPSAGA
jgi:uncharacterized membrane protein